MHCDPNFSDRTVVTYDPRGLGRSARRDGREDFVPEIQAADVHALIQALGAGPVELFGSSGGAVTALALVAAYPDDVTTLVATSRRSSRCSRTRGQPNAPGPACGTPTRPRVRGTGMAAFIAMTSWQDEFTEAVSSFVPDVDALAAASTRVVIAVGEESAGTFTARTSDAAAELLGQRAVVFPSHHGGFLGGELGYAGRPEAFARRLREVPAGVV